MPTGTREVLLEWRDAGCQEGGRASGSHPELWRETQHRQTLRTEQRGRSCMRMRAGGCGVRGAGGSAAKDCLQCGGRSSSLRGGHPLPGGRWIEKSTAGVAVSDNT